MVRPTHDHLRRTPVSRRGVLLGLGAAAAAPVVLARPAAAAGGATPTPTPDMQRKIATGRVECMADLVREGVVTRGDLVAR